MAFVNLTIYDHTYKSSSLHCLKDLGHNKGQDQYYNYYDDDDVENYGKNIVMHWTGGLPVCGHNLNSHRSLITLSPHTQDNDLLLYKYKYMFTIQIIKLQSKNTNSKGANAK